jgi:hypothetical protein
MKRSLPNRGTNPVIAWRDRGKPRNTSVSISSVSAETRFLTEYKSGAFTVTVTCSVKVKLSLLSREGVWRSGCIDLRILEFSTNWR